MQTNHATITLTSKYRIQCVPNVVLIGVPNEMALMHVRDELRAAGVGFHLWEEPDFDMGFTAIATTPLTKQEKQLLSHYRLWRPIFPSSSVKERTASQVAVGSVVEVHPGEPHGSVAQSRALRASADMDVRAVPDPPPSAPLAQLQSDQF